MTDKVKRLIEKGGGSRYTCGELAEAAGVTEGTIRRCVLEGLIYSVKIGGRRYIPEETAVRYLKGEPADEVPIYTAPGVLKRA